MNSVFLKLLKGKSFFEEPFKGCFGYFAKFSSFVSEKTEIKIHSHSCPVYLFGFNF